MAETRVPAKLNASAFNCPFCGAFSSFTWGPLFGGRPGLPVEQLPGHTGKCLRCGNRTYWLITGADHPVKGEMIYPADADAPLPVEDMPDDCAADYGEAREIARSSPRGAAALVRLAIQKLCVHLGGTGENLNADIGELVKNGLPVGIQKALDIVRVTGNNAVHPGEMNIDDNPEIVASLFDLVNLIVENRISEPKRIDKLYSSLPAAAIAAIKKRDDES